MEQLTLDGLKAIEQLKQTPKVSAFMPLYPSGPEVQQNIIRYKNMMTAIETRLRERDIPASELAAMLEPARGLLDNDKLWATSGGGLVMYIAPGFFQFHHLPYAVEERVILSPHFTLTPLMRMFNNNGRYYLLAFSQNNAHLYGANRYEIWPIPMPEDVPTSLAEALRYGKREEELEVHTNVWQGISGEVYQGASEEKTRERIERYLNILDAGLKPMLREERVPMVLAAVDFLQPIYHEQSEYPHIMEKGVIGNPEDMKIDELHAKSLPIVEPVFHKEISAAKETYGDLSATPRSSSDLREIVSASAWARVDTLFVARGVQEWGTFDPVSGKIVVRREGPRTYEDLELVDFATTNTLLNGGSLYVLPQADMPTDKPLAAIFRWEQEK